MQVSEYWVPFWRRRITRPLIMGFFRVLFRLLGSVEITGRENVPLGKPYVVAINHVSTFEAPFVGGFWPEQAEATGAVDVWHRPGQGILARLYGGIQIHRGDVDRQMLTAAISALRSGRALMIAPEGGRSHTPGMRRAKPGIAFIVDATRVPVIPVGIVGTTDDLWKKASRFKRPHVEMHIGKPFLLPPIEGSGIERREARQRNADLVMAHIAGLLPPEYRGVYADQTIDPAQTG
jgi:1-acyl-sn-glycerol-3-phosphate acyltransferase